MLNFDDYTKENKTEIIKVGHILQIILTEY